MIMSGGRCEDNRKGGMVTRAHQPCLNSASSRSQHICVGILRAVGRKGRISRLSHYHGTSGLAQTCGESVDTTVVLILNPCTTTTNTFPTMRRSHRISKSPTWVMQGVGGMGKQSNMMCKGGEMC
jgi:hypothetical protein